MSNALNQVVQMILVPFYAIMSIAKNNHRKDYETGSKDTLNLLAAHGWKPEFPVHVMGKDGRPYALLLFDDEVKIEMTKRTLEWERLKENASKADAAAKAENDRALYVFEKLYCIDGDPAKGLGTPIYSNNAGFRRLRLYFNAMVARVDVNRNKRTKPSIAPDGTVVEVPDTEVLTMIPVMPTVYKTETDRLLAQIEENELSAKGRVPTDPVDKMMLVYDLYQDGCKEVRIREIYSSEVAQTYFGICRLNEFFPELKLYHRITQLEEPTVDAEGKSHGSPDWIKLTKAKKKDILDMKSRAIAQHRKKEGLPLSHDEAGLTPITAEDVDTYFRGVTAKARGDGNADKVMKKQDIIDNAESHPLLMVRSAMSQVANSVTPNSLALAKEFKEPLNKAYVMVQAGQGELLTSVVDATEGHAGVMKDVSDLLKVGKVEELKAVLTRLKAGETFIPATQEVVDEPSPNGQPETTEQLSKKQQKRLAREAAATGTAS